MLLAFLLAPVTAYWSVDQGVDVIFSLMIPPTVMTLLVALANLLVRRLAPRYALTEGELILFYGMHAVLGAICSEWMSVINPYIHSYALFRSSDTRFDRYINPYTHPWFFIQPQDADKFQDYANGGFGFRYFLTHLYLWWPYIASWTALVGLICLAMLCLNALFRKEWTKREKLAFPIIQVPLALAQLGAGRAALFRSRFFVLPFLLMLTIDLENGLHFLVPSLPLINVRFLGDLQLWLPNPPYNAIGWTPIGLFPYISALGVFMPSDLLFSCLFFFFVRKLMQVATFALGYTESAGVFGGGGLVPSPPYFSEQSWGAFLALFVGALWVARPYLRQVWGAIWQGQREAEEGVSPRLAFLGLVVSLLGIGAIGTLIGLPLWMVGLETGLFLAFSVALTRMRAQIGAPSHEMAFMGPNQLLVDGVGTQGLSSGSVSRLVTTFFLYNRIHRTHPMPQQLEAMKLGESVRLNQKALFVGLLLASLLGSVLGHLVYIYKGYRWGAPHEGGDTTDVVATLVNQHRPSNMVAILFVVIGFLVVMSLDFIRFRVPSFPLHPVGYALAMNFGLDYFWFGLSVVWLIKVFVERYYGLKGHEKLHQAALGIILAEYCAEMVWAFYAMVTRQATYSVSFNGRLGWNQ